MLVFQYGTYLQLEKKPQKSPSASLKWTTTTLMKALVYSKDPIKSSIGDIKYLECVFVFMDKQDDVEWFSTGYK